MERMSLQSMAIDRRSRLRVNEVSPSEVVETSVSSSRSSSDGRVRPPVIA